MVWEGERVAEGDTATLAIVALDWARRSVRLEALRSRGGSSFTRPVMTPLWPSTSTQRANPAARSGSACICALSSCERTPGAHHSSICDVTTSSPGASALRKT